MKKIPIIFIVALLLMLTVSVSAFGEYGRLQDTANLLDEYEYNEILTYLDEVSKSQGMDFVILTVDYITEGRTAEEDATEAYEYLGYGEDGVMLYISMAERDWYFLTSGYAVTVINDRTIEAIADEFIYWLSDGYYSEAFETFIQLTDEVITEAKNGETYDYDNEPFPAVFLLVVCLVIGLIISAIVTGVWRLQLSSVGLVSGAANYVKSGGINMRRSEDLFLYKNVSRVARETSSSSGRTSTHRSSSGRTYGGRGGKF